MVEGFSKKAFVLRGATSDTTYRSGFFRDGRPRWQDKQEEGKKEIDQSTPYLTAIGFVFFKGKQLWTGNNDDGSRYVWYDGYGSAVGR